MRNTKRTGTIRLKAHVKIRNTIKSTGENTNYDKKHT